MDGVGWAGVASAVEGEGVEGLGFFFGEGGGIGGTVEAGGDKEGGLGVGGEGELAEVIGRGDDGPLVAADQIDKDQPMLAGGEVTI